MILEVFGYVVLGGMLVAVLDHQGNERARPPDRRRDRRLRDEPAMSEREAAEACAKLDEIRVRLQPVVVNTSAISADGILARDILAIAGDE